MQKQGQLEAQGLKRSNVLLSMSLRYYIKPASESDKGRSLTSYTSNVVTPKFHGNNTLVFEKRDQQCTGPLKQSQMFWNEKALEIIRMCR